MIKPDWDDLPKGFRFKLGMRIDALQDTTTVEAVFSEDEAFCEHVHPNLVIYRTATGEVAGCRVRELHPRGR